MSLELSHSQLMDVIQEWKHGIHFSSYVALCQKAIAADRSLQASNPNAEAQNTQVEGQVDAVPPGGEAAWQGRTFYPEPQGEGWGKWRNVDEIDLMTFQRRVADHPDRYQLRPLYTHPPEGNVPAGWKWLPVEITDAMHVAAVRAFMQCRGQANFPPRVYAAFLASAPRMNSFSEAAPSQKTESKGEKTVSFELTQEECFVWDGASSYPMVTCRGCKATGYGISRLEHQPGCRVVAAFPVLQDSSAASS